MDQPEYKRGLIANKRDAVIALCLTGIVTAFTVRAAVFRSLRGATFHSQHTLPWLFDARFSQHALRWPSMWDSTHTYFFSE
jgi:hypothetical protein